MRKATRILLSLACLTLLAGGALAQEPDAEGCKDPALFNRMPGYRIQRCDEKEFDAHTFRDAKGQEVSVEGRVFDIRVSVVPSITGETLVLRLLPKTATGKIQRFKLREQEAHR